MTRILLAEDHVQLRLLLKGLIEAHEGWQVCGETGDGLEVVAKALELKPDVLVLDFALARLNGLQIAAKVLGVCPTLPIILHTAHVFPAMIAEAKKVGIREVVSKSEIVGRLLDVIETILKENSSTTAPGKLPQPQLSTPKDTSDEQNLPEPN